MNAERLLRHYERIADAPDAIARLRCRLTGGCHARCRDRPGDNAC
jgi:hypothetical protein